MTNWRLAGVSYKTIYNLYQHHTENSFIIVCQVFVTTIVCGSLEHITVAVHHESS